jgi:hypothetical protein
LQCSDQTGVWTDRLRFGWLDTAGTGLFMVYNQRQLMEVSGIAGILPGSGEIPPERTLVIKYTRGLDFSGIGSI